MADWRGVSEGMNRGFQRGAAIGGKLSPLGEALKSVAERLKTQRVQGEEMGMKKELLGSEEASKMRLLEKAAELEWKPGTKEEALEFEGVSHPQSQSDKFRNAIESSVAKIRAGGKPAEEKKSLMFDYPSNYNPGTHGINLERIGEESKKDLGKLRSQAIQELKRSKYPVTENNIKSAMEQLRG